MKIKIITLLMLFSTLLGAKELEKVSLQLQGFDQFRFAGYYVAKEKGYYSDAGLDVEIMNFKPGTDPVEKVISHEANYATGKISLIVDRAKGKKVVALAAVLQSSPSAMVAKKSSGIKELEDFKGKRVMMTGSELSISVPAMLMSKKLTFDNMQLQLGPNEMEKFFEDKTDVISVDASNQIYFIQKRGIELNIFHPKDYGFDFYSELLFTSEDEVKNHKRRTVDFSNASLRGWEYAFSHIDETVELILAKYNTQNKSRESLIFEANTLKELAYADNEALGHIDSRKIKRIYDIYHLMGSVRNKIDIDKFVAHDHRHIDIYLTDEEKAYLQKKKRIKMCVAPSMDPIEKIVDGKYRGITADVFTIFQEQLPLPIEIVEAKTNEESLSTALAGKCDIASVVVKGFSPFTTMQSTLPYIEDSFVVITKVDKPFIQNLKRYENKKFVVTFDEYQNYFNERFPFLDIVVAKDGDEALRWLNDNKVYGYIDLSLIANNIVHHYWSNTLKINMKVEDTTVQGGIAILKSEPQLLAIFNKLIKNLPDLEVEKIKAKWSMQTYEEVVDYTLIKQLVIGFLLILVVVLLFLIQQNRLKKQIEEQKEAFENLYKKSPDGILLIKDGKFIDCNEAIVDMLGFKSKEQLMHTHPSELSPEFQPDGRSSFEKAEEMMQAAMQKGSNRFEWMHTRADGEDFWSEIILTKININNKDVIHVVWRDISDSKTLEVKLQEHTKELERQLHRLEETSLELKRSDEFMKKSHEIAHIGIWELDHQKDTLYWSEEVYDIFGVDQADFKLSYSTFLECVYPEDREMVGQAYASSVEEKYDYWTSHRILRPDGSLRYVEERGNHEFDEDGKIVKTIGVMFDTTKQKELEIMLISLNKNLDRRINEEVEKNKLQQQKLFQQSRMAQMGEMISMIAHQWRQPLGAISSTSIDLTMQIELEAFDLTQEAGRRECLSYFSNGLSEIDRFVQNLTTTIDDFRNFYKPNKEKKRCAVNKSVKKGLGVVNASLLSDGIEVVEEYKSDAMLDLYSNELMQVILNILKNAQDNFLENNVSKPKIVIKTYDTPKHGVVEISDNGGGIPEQAMAKIFDPYFSTKDEKNGTGLGLYMSKTIVEDHHKGKLRVVNRDDGACFIIELKRK